MINDNFFFIVNSTFQKTTFSVLKKSFYGCSNYPECKFTLAEHFSIQMNKGGKFIFGKSLIRTDGTLRIPPQAMEEYHIADEGKVYLFTGSKITGGFCVTRKGLLHPSKLGHILDDTPPLLDYSAGSGEFIKYKGRSYCWVEISREGQILLTKKMMDFLKVRPGMELLSIRSSDIAFTMGAKGPLLEKAENYDGEIPLF